MKIHINFRFIAFTVVLSVLLGGVSSCSKKRVFKPVNPAFREYIQAFSSGIIPANSTIKIRLANDFADSVSSDTPVKEKLFDFSPSINGSAYWLDKRTIEFRPEKSLPPDEYYNAKFFLSKLIQVPDSLNTFEFQFLIMQQDYEVIIDNHKAIKGSDLSRERIYGTVYTADMADVPGIEKIIKASQESNDLPVTWTHEPGNKTHHFRIDSVIRRDIPGKIIIKWDGRPINARTDGDTTIEIRPISHFGFIQARVVQEQEPFIVAQFSDPLLENQNLDGLLKVNRSINMRYAIEDNEIRIYPSEFNTGRITLSIEPSVKNINGKTLGIPVVREIIFEDIKPNIRLVGEGVIMPGSAGLLLPFEAVNLKAVDVKVIKVFENNILQFLQINELDGRSELARVGKTILKKTVPLNNVSNYGKWNRFSLDLSDMVKTEPGAIYSIRLSFRYNYSTFPCSGKSGEEINEPLLTTINDIDEEKEEAQYYYDYYDESEYYYDEEGNYIYNWRERNNPCSPSYFTGKSITRNVLASDLGLIVKAGSDGEYHVFATDIITTKPMSDVDVQFFDYRQQLVGSGETDGDGMAEVTLSKKPFVLVARKDKQTGYLKIIDGSSLSLSMFDVSGETVQKGIKGMIYGERGVWRPGDSIYISFILEDKLLQLPEHHPVTFSLYNPTGQLVTNLVRTSSVGGFYNFSTVTDRNAPTGNWHAKVKVGGAEFDKTIKVETVKPNRLKINLDFGVERLIKGRISKATLRANWLTGAVAKNLKTMVTLSLNKSETSFKKLSRYVFDNPYSGFTSENMTIFSGNLDETGKAVFLPQIELTTVAPGMLNANFETTVYEDGGDFSVDRFSLPFFPFSSYAGIYVPQNKENDRMLYTDRKYNFDLINVDVNGNMVSSGKLMVMIYKLSWNWWWDNSYTESSADFISSLHNQLVDSLTLMTIDGKATFPFQVKHDEWGRYYIRLVDMKSGHSAGKVVYFDWYGYYRSPGGEKQSATMLTFSADKEKYKPGEKVKLNIPSSAGGRVLITIENGTKVLQSAWIQTTEKSTEYTFRVTEEMAPNCYAYATMVQPHAQVKNDLLIRLYGVIPIFVENPETHLRPQIQMKEVLVPEQAASITIKEEKGRPMNYTLAIVDEGLLDLTRFRTPDPWQVFYAREALGVKTWDLFDQVMNAFSGELQRILSIGGDEEGDAKGNLKANRFKPMVKFLGPFELKKGMSKTHTFTMPQYVGSVRVMVVAGRDGAFGSAEKTATVRKPLMVLGTMPRVVGPGETVKLPVNVFAMEKTVRDVIVKVSAGDLFTLTSGDTRQINFKTIGDQMVTFDLKVKESIGIGKIKIVAGSGNEKATYDIEIDVRNPNSKITDVTEGVIDPGKTWNTAYTPVGMAGTNKGVLEISSVPPLNLEQRLNFLIEYPHGCIEQTTSSVFPQLYLSDFIELTKTEQGKTENNIKAAIRRLKSFQLSNGGLGYWPGAQFADDWGTSYAGHFLLEAEKKGYALPVGFLEGWKNFQKQRAIAWVKNSSEYNNDLIQAYRLYTLAIAKTPELGAMNKLLEFKGLSNTARWRLAAAYMVAGKPETAKNLIATAGTDIKPYCELSYSYGSDVRDKAMIIETLCLLGMKSKAASLVKELSQSLSRNLWYSTQTTAYCLIAVSGFLQGSSGHNIDISYKIDNEKQVNVKSSKPVFKTGMNIRNSVRPGKINVINNGENILYARLILTGIPASGTSKSYENDLKLEVKYKSLEGKSIVFDKLEQGTNFIAEVKITNPGIRGYYKQLALTQVFPSGWEIINTRMSEFANTGTNSSYCNYQDIRDDRVYTYFDLGPRAFSTYQVMLSANYLGKFFLPGAYCEAMYDHTINANSTGTWIEVVPSVK